MLLNIEPGFPTNPDTEYRIVEVYVEYFDRPEEPDDPEPECE